MLAITIAVCNINEGIEIETRHGVKTKNNKHK